MYGSAVTEQIVADDIHIDITTDIKGVTSAVTHQHCRPIFACAEDKEVVIAFHAIHFNALDVFVGDIQPGTIDTVFGNDKIVRKFGADNDHGIDPFTAIDAYRGINYVLDFVIACAAIDKGHSLLGKVI